MPRTSELLNDLTTQIGYGETIELLRAWGGRRLSVPKEMPEDHPIALTIGLGPAQLLASYYGGANSIELPAERNALMQVRNDAIIRDLTAGVPTRSCAIRYGVTPRHVRHIRQRYEREQPEKAGADI